MKTKKDINRGIQFELFSENDYRELTDRQLIENLTNHVEEVADVWENSYRMELLYNKLTPHVRRIAMTAVELYKRKDVTRRKREKISSAMDIYYLMKPLVADLPYEEVWLIGLSTNNNIISKQRISIGGMTDAVVDARIIIGKAIEWQATQIALVHNHPSGNTRPSQIDNQMTKRLAEASKIMGIRLIDHVIVTHNGYYSFSEEGAI